MGTWLTIVRICGDTFPVGETGHLSRPRFRVLSRRTVSNSVDCLRVIRHDAVSRLPG